jgi:hypothetical protein
MDGLMGRLGGFEPSAEYVNRRGLGDDALDGWMGIPKHGYFFLQSLFKRCSTP